MIRSLLITPISPWPPTRGGSQRTNLIFKALSQLGRAEVLLVGDPELGGEDVDKLTADFNMVAHRPLPRRGESGIWQFVRPLHPQVVDRFAHNLGNHTAQYEPDKETRRWLAETIDRRGYDIIVGRYLMPAARTGALDLHPVIVDVDDLDTRIYESRLRAPTTPLWQRPLIGSHLNRYRKAIPPFLKKADHLWLTNHSDLDQIDHSSVSIIPNVPYQSSQPANDVPFAQNESSKMVLLVASMSFPVNERGAERFITRIWPRVLAHEPAATLVIVGAKMSNAQRSEWSSYDNITALGFVGELSDLYRDCAFTVSPIFEGGGTKIKVVESLYFGRTCVITGHSQRGYETVLKHKDSLMVADEDVEFVDSCVYLLRNAAERRRMAQRGTSLVRAHYSFESFSREVARSVKSVLGDRRRHNTVSNGVHAI